MVIPLLVCTTSLSVLDLDEFVLVKGNPDVSLILASDSALLTFLCSVTAEEIGRDVVAGESIVRKLTACDSPPNEVFEQAVEAAVTRPVAEAAASVVPGVSSGLACAGVWGNQLRRPDAVAVNPVPLNTRDIVEKS
jgi:hypothetical protein